MHCRQALKGQDGNKMKIHVFDSERFRSLPILEHVLTITILLQNFKNAWVVSIQAKRVACGSYTS